MPEMAKKKKLKLIYIFDAAVTNWQERLDTACDLVFRKIAQEYEGEKKNYARHL